MLITAFIVHFTVRMTSNGNRKTDWSKDGQMSNSPRILRAISARLDGIGYNDYEGVSMSYDRREDASSP